ncbi:MAG TPA: tRNA uridine-5-carboxymethylaminomethyl(34) synthesis GTPase MnmE [bacterium]|nr:tRNA uridine-5-carboxymethylaminomethyl(34) synthesis GTPase MnmE [bacterium]HEX68270.1 tRNA uridine-5-carboxymethylaminomethyl(34) synthesis GTPase MnmE [bacterium]
MRLFSLEDTIAAISTPLGEGGIGIVRISGPKSLEIADRLFRGKIKPSQAPTYTTHYGKIVHKGEVIDEVILTVMRAPKSYTREDVVEINCHGGIFPLRKTLEAVLEEGARLAKPGEFTLRAFLNGRIDLTQAEAVLEIVRAKSEIALKNALSQLEGGLSKYIREVEREIVDLLTFIEAGLDFPEEEIELLSREEIKKRLEGIHRKISSLLEREKEGHILREGIKVSIVGKPNVGKSTLLNSLLGKEKAIVTEIPGTTRDLIEDWITIQGIPFHLVDTAGWRETQDLVEREGVKRTKMAMDISDLLLVVLDRSEPLEEEDKWLLQHTKNRKRILVINKIDLPPAWSPHNLPSPKIQISALTQKGLNDLRKEMAKCILKGEIEMGEGPIITNLRHLELLKTAYSYIKNAMESLNSGLSEEFIAQDLKTALSSLKEILGEEVGEEILENIFSRFCIGK